MAVQFKDKRILVTGGTGSIGSAIVKELLKDGPRQIRVFSRDETKQFELRHELDLKAPVSFLVGDVRDKERLNLAMENIDVVFHAAALKHVTACENNPFEAVKTNVQGTQNVIDCAYANGVDKVVMISTDKATDPTNVMGCTKLLAEKLILSSILYRGDKKTKFCCVRFGNVLASRGSVVPLFLNQLKRGQPLTVTDPSMTRFIMSISQAVGLVFKATEMMKSNEIFVLKMPVVTLKDLARAVIEVYEEKNNVKIKPLIKIIGRGAGERTHEKLLTAEEAAGALETGQMFIILPGLLEPGAGYDRREKNAYPGAKPARIADYTSAKAGKLKLKEIKKLLLSNGDLKIAP